MPRFPHLTRSTAAAFKAAIDKVPPDARPRWGSMDAPRMMAHLARSIDISMDKVHVPPVGNWLTHRTIFRRVIFEWLPWPKGKIKAPAEFCPDASDFHAARADAHRAIDEFVAMVDADPARTTVSAIMGPVPMSYWALIHGRHICWHLDQFGAAGPR